MKLAFVRLEVFFFNKVGKDDLILAIPHISSITIYPRSNRSRRLLTGIVCEAHIMAVVASTVTCSIPVIPGLVPPNRRVGTNLRVGDKVLDVLD